MPPTTGPGFRSFREHVVRAASSDLERLHPAWVGYVRHASERGVIWQLGTTPPKYRAAGFAGHRALLAHLMDFELHLRHLAALSRLLADVPSDGTLGELNVSEDEWAWVLIQDHAVALFGLLDRVTTHLPRAARPRVAVSESKLVQHRTN